MPYSERVEIYKEIEEYRKKPLIAYVTSIRDKASGGIASDIIPEIARQLIEISKDQKEIDILIVSNGGDPLVSWRIICMLRERFDKITVLLPFVAYSAATLFALGADEIIMHPFSNLGPVDPQLEYIKQIPGQPPQIIHFGPEDLKYFLNFINDDVGLTDQEQKEKTFEFVCKEIGTIPIGIAKRSLYLTTSLGEKLLSTHMEDQNKVKSIIESLNTSFYSHGYPLDRQEGKKIGLPIVDTDKELESLLWKVWQDIEDEMQCNLPFNPLEYILKDPTVSKLLDSVPQLQIPSNLPSNIMNQVIQNVLNLVSLVQIPAVNYDLFIATLESIRCKSEYYTKGKINAVRLPNLAIQTYNMPISSGWKFYKNKER